MRTTRYRQITLVVLYILTRSLKSHEPVLTIHLRDAKYDLHPTEECPYPFLTISLPNSEKHIFTAEAIAEWHGALRHATRICKPQSPSLVFSHPRPANRGSVNPMQAVNANELLKRKTMSGFLVTPYEPQPRDHAIVAWTNFCCNRAVILSPMTMTEGMSFLVCLESGFQANISQRYGKYAIISTNKNPGLESLILRIFPMALVLARGRLY